MKHKERKLLNELFGQDSAQGRGSEVSLPRIKKSVSNSNSKHRGSTNSVHTHLSQRKQFKNDRWKANQLYIDDYLPSSNRRIQTENKKSDETVEVPKKKAFFTGLNSDSSDGQDYLMKINKQQIKSYVENAQGLINIIKKNRPKLIKLKINGPKKYKQEGYFKEKSQRKDQIYNYFFRDFLNKKQQEISQDIIVRYVAHSSPDNLRSIQQKGRQFLLNKMQNDYKNFDKVEDYKKYYIRSLILQCKRVLIKKQRTKKLTSRNNINQEIAPLIFPFQHLAKVKNTGSSNDRSVDHSSDIFLLYHAGYIGAGETYYLLHLNKYSPKPFSFLR